jgi:hypothetical protein
MANGSLGCSTSYCTPWCSKNVEAHSCTSGVLQSRENVDDPCGLFMDFCRCLAVGSRRLCHNRAGSSYKDRGSCCTLGPLCNLAKSVHCFNLALCGHLALPQISLNFSSAHCEISPDLRLHPDLRINPYLKLWIGSGPGRDGQGII